jgi:hypothetical protein
VVNSGGTAYGYDVVHINAEFTAQRSDHDPGMEPVPARSVDGARGRLGCLMLAALDACR